MSYAEIHQEKGMPFGGIRYDEILYKLEETDPELVADVRGNDPFHAIEDDYDDYLRAEIIDRAPEDAFLESDHPRRDPVLSRTVLNLRHAGGRGPNDFRLPQHPEIFLGFSGNDPRGAMNEPRLDQLRAQTASRAREREVRMGHNVGHGDFIEAARPWGGMAIEYDKEEVRRRMKGSMRWFPAEKVGRPWGRNTVADAHYGLRQRHEVVGGGGEGLYTPEQDQPRSEGWPHQRGNDPVRGAEGGAPRRVDRHLGADSAPWRHTTADADLAVARYGATARSGRETFGPHASGGARAAAHRADGAFGAHTRGTAVNRRVLAEGMSAAAARRRASNRHQGGEAAHGHSVQVLRLGRSAPEHTEDVALAGRQGHHDQAVRSAGAVQDHEGGLLGAGSGLAPPGDRQAALRAAQPTHTDSANARLAFAGAMVRGVRGDAPAGIRMVQGLAVAAGRMGGATAETPSAIVGGLAPPDAAGSALRQGVAVVPRAAAAADLEVHRYGQRTSANLQKPMGVVRSARASGFSSARAELLGRREGRTKAPEFRSHTLAPSALGADVDRTFGAIGEHSAPHTGAVSIGQKSLSAAALTDGGDDVMDHRGFHEKGEAVDASGFAAPREGGIGGDLFSGSSNSCSGGGQVVGVEAY